jgi:hypothetical protein
MAQAMIPFHFMPATQVSAQALQTLLDADFHREVTRQVAREADVDETVAAHRVLECLRFLYLTSAYPQQLSGLFLPVEQCIDDVWHFLILQTREYRTLCEERLPGRFFIEHRSLPYAAYQAAPSREALIEQALRWIPLYRDTFGAFGEHAAPYWTMVTFLREQLGMTLAQISAIEAETVE